MSHNPNAEQQTPESSDSGNIVTRIIKGMGIAIGHGAQATSTTVTVNHSGVWVGVVIVALVALVALVIIFVLHNPSSPLSSSTPTPGPVATPTAFPPAGEGESLIIVADFADKSDGECSGHDPDNYIYRRLTSSRDDMRVERLDIVLDSNNARQVGEVYNATLVLWGQCDAAGITPYVERIKDLNGGRSDEESQSVLIYPERIEVNITEDLPALTNYLVLYILGADRYDAEDYPAARRYLLDAIDATRGVTATVKPDEAYFLLGNIAYHEKDYGGADQHFADAIDIFEDYEENPSDIEPPNQTDGEERLLNRDLSRADALYNRGITARRMGRYDAAQSNLEDALKQFRNDHDQEGEARALNSLGNVARELEDYEKAIDYHNEALELFGKLKDQQGEANALNNLGIVHGELGEYKKAIGYYQDSIEIKREIGDRRGEARSLGSLGYAYSLYASSLNTYFLIEQYGATQTLFYEAAHMLSSRAHGLFEEQGDDASQARVLVNLANIQRERGEYHNAHLLSSRALELFREQGDVASQARVLVNSGGIATFYEGKAASVSKIIYTWLDICGLCRDKKFIHFARLVEDHNLERAEEILQTNLDAWEDLEDDQNIAVTRGRLAAIYQEQGNLERAAELLRDNLSFYLDNDDEQGETITRAALDQVQQALRAQGE
jgi:tetratricopeptide (TPR) repeat protein